jgi:hypothetical protein
MKNCHVLVAAVLFSCVYANAIALTEEESCPLEKPSSQFNPHATGVLKHSFKSKPNREAVEIVYLESGDRIEILYRGCEYEELQIQIESSKFSSLTTNAAIYNAAGIAINGLPRYTTKSIYVFPFGDVAKALLSAGKKKTPPPLQSDLEIPIVEGMSSTVTIDSFKTNNKSGILTISMNRGPL